MALNQARRWLIAYDIRDRRRLARVHRFLMHRAIPVQYSVFAVRGSLADVRRMADELRTRIDERADDVRIYPIPENPLVHAIGATLLPDDVWLLDAKTGLGAVLAPPSRVESTPAEA
jgi:CRISPR-associated protein Cas2